MTIPRIFHHVWVSGDEMPAPVLEARQTWIDLHPDWEFRVWRLEDLTWLRNQTLFDRAVPYSQKADFARYEVVDRFGGVYLDTDMECLRPLDSILEGCRFFSGREPSGNVGSAIFGAVPAHPIVREVIERLPASCYFHETDQLSYTAGPMVLNRVLRDGSWEGQPDVRTFPAAYFFPYGGWEPWRRNESFSRAYAVHHWGHSWKAQRGVRVNLSDLLPPRGEPILPAARAVWREAGDRTASEWAATMTTVRQRLRDLARPSYRLMKGIAGRTMPAQAPRSLAWGPDGVLVATPFHTRLLCPVDDLSIAPELALTGMADRHAVDLARRLRPGMTFVDVGASFGFSTILGAARVGPRGRVFSYECHPELIEFVRRNVAMNQVGDRVSLIPRAADRDEEDRTLHVPRHLKGLGTLMRLDEGSVDVQEFPVPCERLDVGLGDVSYIDLLKIDVKGGEAAVLEGASGLLDAAKIGAIAMRCVAEALSRDLQEEMAKLLTSLAQDRDASLHELGRPRRIPLDEVLTVFDFPQLLIRFPGASVEP